MGRNPCCDKTGLNKGPWTPAEDQRLITYIQNQGHSNWRALPKQAGLLRCGKSCRLRWTNYLRPDIKRGNFTKQEEETIINLQQSLGNKWSKIASQLPGRTDNEIKNVWNTHLKKQLSSKDAISNNKNNYNINHNSCGEEQQQKTSSSSSSSSSSSTSCIIQDIKTTSAKRALSMNKKELSSDSYSSSISSSNHEEEDFVAKEKDDDEQVVALFHEIQFEPGLEYLSLDNLLLETTGDQQQHTNYLETSESDETQRWLTYLEYELIGLPDQETNDNESKLKSLITNDEEVVQAAAEAKENDGREARFDPISMYFQMWPCDAMP